MTHVFICTYKILYKSVITVRPIILILQCTEDVWVFLSLAVPLPLEETVCLTVNLIKMQ